MAWSVSSASQRRQSRPSARSSRGVSTCPKKVLHSSARRAGSSALWRLSTQPPQSRPASSTDAAQLVRLWGGHVPPPGGENTKRYACVWSRSASVRANRSGGHSKIWSVIGPPANASQVDAAVGSAKRALGHRRSRLGAAHGFSLVGGHHRSASCATSHRGGGRQMSVAGRAMYRGDRRRSQASRTNRLRRQ